MANVAPAGLKELSHGIARFCSAQLPWCCGACSTLLHSSLPITGALTGGGQGQLRDGSGGKREVGFVVPS